MLADPTIRIMVYQPINAAPQKSRSTLSIVLIVVGAVVALCCVGGVAGGGFLYYTYSSNAGPVREATTTYVDDVRAGITRARTECCAARYATRPAWTTTPASKTRS